VSAAPESPLGTPAASPSGPAAGDGVPGLSIAAGLATIYLVWGSTYLAIRIMVETIPPALGGGVRFVVAGAAMVAWLTATRGTGALRFSRRELAAAAVVGSLLCAAGNGLVTVAERDVPSGLAALIVASVPLWVVVFRALSGERVPGRTLVGVATGFGGVGLLLLPGEPPGGASTLGVLLVVIAAFGWALGTFASARLPTPRDPLAGVAVQMLIGGGVLALAGLLAGEGGRVEPAAFSSDSVLALVYLILVGSIVAFSAFGWLLRHAPVSLVATYAYVNPVIAVLLGWLVLSEEVTGWTIAGAAVIVASVALVLRAPAPPPAQDGRIASDHARRHRSHGAVSLAGRRPADPVRPRHDRRGP